MAPTADTTARPTEVDCTWGNENAVGHYLKVSDGYDFHQHCNRYGTFVHLGNLHGLRVLDLPSGPGVYARTMLEKGASVVTSVDIDANFVSCCRTAVHQALELPGREWHGVVGDASIVQKYPGGPFDVVRANFLLENLPTLSMMYDCAKNVYTNLKPGGRYVGIWAPGAHSPENRRAVMETVNMSTSDITTMKLGDECTIQYMDLPDSNKFHWFLRSEEQVKHALESAGFVDVRFERLMVNPDYNGSQDLHRFVQHVGNRHVFATKPETATD